MIIYQEHLFILLLLLLWNSISQNLPLDPIFKEIIITFIFTLFHEDDEYLLYLINDILQNIE